MRQILAAALIASAVSACDENDIPFVGPCSVFKRVTAEKTYSDLGLTIAVRDTLGLNIPMRQEFLSKIQDECLRSYVEKHTAIIENDNKNREERKIDRNNRERALTDRLGMRP